MARDAPWNPPNPQPCLTPLLETLNVRDPAYLNHPQEQLARRERRQTPARAPVTDSAVGGRCARLSGYLPNGQASLFPEQGQLTGKILASTDTARRSQTSLSRRGIGHHSPRS